MTGTLKCGKPDTSQSVEVGDEAGHMLVVEKGSCSWSVPAEMAGLKATAWTAADVVDAMGPKFQMQGYGVMTMDNGDKAYVRFQGPGSMKDGAATNEGTWYFTSGTGKLKGLKGKGTYKGSGKPDESTETRVSGEYSLP